jgi:hypothetical protein
MHYKTITLELLRQNPFLHRRLQDNGTLMQSLNHCAGTLRERHLAWMDSLSRTRPQSDPGQISSEALELALQELRDALPAESAQSNVETAEAPSLDAAMTYLRRHTPPAS